MTSPKLKEIQVRWSAQQAEEGLAGLRGRLNPTFPLLDNGLVDFRGIKITEAIKGAEIESIDLSGAVFEKFGQFATCNVRNTRFCSASLQTNLGNNFTSCDFSSAKLSGAVLRGLFASCDFSRANLTAAMGNQVRFVKCVFVETNFSKATFIHCIFEDCQFVDCKFRSGSLSFSKFVRSSLLENDTENTLMERVVFL